MADRVVTLDLGHGEADAASMIGKVVNIYDTYAHALAHAATGLSTVKAVNRLTGVVGSAISQTAKTAGPTVDLNGKLVFAVDDGVEAYWAMCVSGRWGGPLRVDIAEYGTT